EAAALTFIDERAKIQKLVTAGHPPDYLVFDGPVRRMIYPYGVEANYHSHYTAATATINAVQYWKAEFPEIKIYLLSNFPNWGWKGSVAYNNHGYTAGTMGLGDYFTILNVLYNTAINAGVELEGFMMDNPYDYTTKLVGSNQWSLISGINFWDRLRDFQNVVEGLGLKSALIYNSERGGTTSNYLFWKDTLDYLGIYTTGGPETVGGPNTHVTNIESWHEFPTSVLPDYTLFTLSNTAAHAWYYFDN
ncbi:MAG: hypothetical protein Q8L68_04090, partial [Methylococcales bacterium]|nr:hypothetical protein [Methylococcales bacterium]